MGVHDSNHFGATGYYSDMALMQDMIGVVIANTEPAVAPLGGKEPIIGTNPLAIGIPSNKNYISMDMATSASARENSLRQHVRVRRSQKTLHWMPMEIQQQILTRHSRVPYCHLEHTRGMRLPS